MSAKNATNMKKVSPKEEYSEPDNSSDNGEDDEEDSEDGGDDEEAEGEGDTSKGDDKHVVISEDFQKQACALCDGASKEELGFIADYARKAQYKMEDEERAKKGDEMDTAGMPA